MFAAREGLELLEEYSVEHIAADIVVNANENNYPMPAEIEKHVREMSAAFEFNRYPSMHGEPLCDLIAEDLGLKRANVKIGNGSSELLQMACYAFGGRGRKIAVPFPSFSMYGVYTQMADSEALLYPLDEEGYVNADAVIELCKKENPALLIVCNPNNPTGNYNALSAMEKILANVECPVIMDEAYMEFASASDENSDKAIGSTLSYINKYDNFICLRTFSKAYGLAGLRIGYGVGAERVMKILGKTLLPYHVNAYSAAVAQILYKDKSAYQAQREEIIAERENLRANLIEMGFKVWPSATNFLACRVEDSAKVKVLAERCRAKYGLCEEKTEMMQAGMYLYRGLLEAGILVRDYTAHKLLQGCMRITVGRPEENVRIVEVLKNLCKEDAL